jgi:hypothetical protein
MFSLIDDLLVEALFASDVQPSDAPTPETVQHAITRTIVRFGTDGCAAQVAAEFGDHPDIAVCRMAWVRETLNRVGAAGRAAGYAGPRAGAGCPG